jgi:putative ABC transport system permease protein
MGRITLTGLRAHKIRYALTTVAILLGVAFMAGTFVLTDTIGRTFDGLFTDIYGSTSAVVRGAQAYEPQLNFGSQRPTINAGLEYVARAVPGVTEVRVGLGGYAQLVDRDGNPIGNPATGAPTLGQAWSDATATNPYEIVEGGRPPESPDEVLIDKHSADVGHFSVGDQVTVLTKRQPGVYRIVGLVRWGGADSPLGASITVFTRATAEQVLTEPGKVDEIAVAAEPGISQEEMVARLRAAMPDPTLDIVTGEEITREGQTSVREALSFFNTFLLVFALIALFVGSFLIFNTFSIVVAQRLRELALLRAVGASRLQLAGSVLTEALVIGFIASAAGVGVGIGLAYALRAMLGALGVVIPSSGLVVTAPRVLVCLAAGTIITLLASVAPARRAATIPPVAALHEAVGGSDARLLRRTVAGAVVLTAGAIVLAVGLFADVRNRVELVGAGSAALFVGLAMLGPLVARPAARTLGAPVAARGAAGELARNNAIRNPRRTAATAAALMVGVAVVCLMTVVAASMKASVNSVVDASMRADFVVSSGGQPGGLFGLSPSLQRDLAKLPEVASSTGVRAGAAEVDGTGTVLLAADPRRVDDLFDIGLVEGDLAEMTDEGVAISSEAAKSRALSLGQHVDVTFPATGVQTFTVQAIYKARELAGDYVLPLSVAVRNFPTQLDFQVYVRLADGVTLDEGRAALAPIVAGYPTASLLDRAEYKEAQVGQIDQLLNLVYGLLGLALLIALIGIANTLGLAIHERTRELGLLRAVGMTRGQLRSAVRYESLIVAVLGAVEGLLAGLLLGWALVRALRGQGITEFAVPAWPLLLVAVLAGFAGVVAAIAPSRRAARLDILQAIASE